VANATSLTLLQCAGDLQRYVGKTTKGKVLVELGKNHIRGSDKVNQKKSIFLGFMKWEY